MHKLRCVFIAGFSFFIFVSLQAQLKRPDGKIVSTTSINQLVTGLMQKGEVTGLCLGIINDNKPVYIHTYGYKNKPLD